MILSYTTALHKADQARRGSLKDLGDLLDALVEARYGADLEPTPVVSITDATTYTVLAADSGRVHVMPDLAADCTITLPTAANGLVYEFILGAAIDAAHDWIFSTGSATNYFVGGLQYNSDAPASDSVASDGNSNDFMRVLTPEAGTWVKMLCDGTNWFVTGVVHTENAPTFADT